MNTPAQSDLPVVSKADILILGGTSAAVAFALSARERGHSVFMAAPRTYLGEDICGAFRYWPERSGASTDLAKRIYGDGSQPPKPLEVKSILEQALVAADVPFVFNTMPAGVLRNAEGVVVGAVLGNRSGRQVALARLVVDASPEGTFLRQAGAKGIARLSGQQTIDWVTLRTEADSIPANAPTFVDLAGYDEEDYTLHARRFTLEVDFGDGSIEAVSEARIDAVRRCWSPGTFQQQSMLLAPTGKAERSPTVADLEVAPGLLALTEALPLSGNAHATFANPVTAIAAGAAMGAAVEVPNLRAFDRSGFVVDCAGAEPVANGEVRTLADAFRPRTKAAETVAIDSSRLPVLGKFDVVVVGGGTGGAPAAIGSSRAGARTLVVEIASALGGVGTVGQICSYYWGNRVGFTTEVDLGVAKLEVDERFKKAKGVWSPAAKAHWLYDEGANCGASYLFNTVSLGVLMDGDTFRGVIVSGPQGFGLIRAGHLVDATGCADLPAAAGAETQVIGKDHVAVQGTGLAAIKPKRAYNNSDHSFSDDTDLIDATAFFVSSRRKFKGEFDLGELVDSRERRQIIGDIKLSAVDILYKRRFPDTVSIASSNFDTHGYTIDPCFMIIPPDKSALAADVPLRALLPRGLKGILVTGLGVSAHRDAIPVIRMQACVQNQGYAAGRIAALAAQAKTDAREVDIRDVQRHLIEVDCLPDRVLSDTDSFPVSDETLAQQVAEGWDEPGGVALILHEGARSLPLIRQAYEACTGRDARSLRYAQLLAFLGDASGEAELRDTIDGREWDAGWNYKGMGQFGMSMSELDGLIVALGEVGGAATWPILFRKVEALHAESEFSHFRAIAMAAESLFPRCPSDEVADRLAALLDIEGVTGHAITTIPAFFAVVDQNNKNVEDSVRNKSLREIHVARALLACGDVEGRGAAIIAEYAKDLRGHYSRHARALLEANGAGQETRPLAAGQA